MATFGIFPSATAALVPAVPNCPALTPGEPCTGNDSRSQKGDVGREEGQPGVAAELPRWFLPVLELTACPSHTLIFPAHTKKGKEGWTLPISAFADHGCCWWLLTSTALGWWSLYEQHVEPSQTQWGQCHSHCWEIFLNVVASSHSVRCIPQNQAELSCCQGRHGEQQGSTLSPGVSISSCLKPGVRMKSVSDINKGSLYIF